MSEVSRADPDAPERTFDPRINNVGPAIDTGEIERRIEKADRERNIGKAADPYPGKINHTNGNGIKSTVTLTDDVDKLIDSLNRRIKMLEAFKATL